MDTRAAAMIGSLLKIGPEPRGRYPSQEWSLTAMTLCLRSTATAVTSQPTLAGVACDAGYQVGRLAARPSA